MDNKQARYLHRMLDRLAEGKTLSPEDIEALRKNLPELPKQKTLEEIHEEVYEKWLNVEGDLWDSDNWGTVEEFLGDLQYQLKDLIDAKPTEPAPTNTPALPAGMRIAKHVNFGRVVVSPGVDIDGCHEIFYLDPGMASGTDISGVEPDSLTFLDSEPGHPEFLETEGDYASAPKGTIAAKDGWLSWLKETDGVWSCAGSSEGESSLAQSGKRRVLRWGWSK